MKKGWTKRKLFSVGFTGRQRRALLWQKKVYKEWYEYCLLALLAGRSIPAEFGDLTQFKDFEEWWRHEDYGFELFCEQYAEDLVQVVSGDEQALKVNHLRLDINLTGDLDKILALVKSELQRQQVSSNLVSNARFKPALEMKHMKADSLALGRKVWMLHWQGMRQADIVEQLGIYAKAKDGTEKSIWKQMDGGIRKVQRHIKSVEEIFDRIEQGTFP